MSIKETSGNALTGTAITSSVAGANGWVNENYQILMLCIALVSTVGAIWLGILNHRERKRATNHLVNGE